jgi:hypothetical protein
VVYRRNKKEIQIVKPSEHGLGIVTLWPSSLTDFSL